MRGQEQELFFLVGDGCQLCGVAVHYTQLSADQELEISHCMDSRSFLLFPRHEAMASYQSNFAGLDSFPAPSLSLRRSATLVGTILVYALAIPGDLFHRKFDLLGLPSLLWG